MSRAARWLGILLQALILGGLLFLSAGRLVAVQTDARVFKYEGY